MQMKKTTDGHDARVPEEWLLPFRHRKEAEELERLSGDIELLNDLVVVGFRGKRWDYLETVLIRYGFQVLKSWLITGLIFQRVSEKGFGLYLSRIRRDRIPSPEDAEEIASDTLVESIPRFRDEVLRPGLWQPELGASLKTYFIGQCLMRVPKAMGRWSRRVSEEIVVDPSGVDFATSPSFLNSPEEYLAFKIKLEEAKQAAPPKTLAIAYLRIVEGCSHSEIAEVLGVTIGAIESRLYRLEHATK